MKNKHLPSQGKKKEKYNKFWLENRRSLNTIKEYVRFLFSKEGQWHVYPVVIPTWLIKIKYKYL